MFLRELQSKSKLETQGVSKQVIVERLFWSKLSVFNTLAHYLTCTIKTGREAKKNKSSLNYTRSVINQVRATQGV